MPFEIVPPKPDKIIQLLDNEEGLDELLQSLDDIAREVSSYEYGLPLYDDHQRAHLRAVATKWIITNVLKE